MSGSLSLTPNFFKVDAFKLAPAVFYEPEKIKLGEYGFVPWVRSGLSAAIQSPLGDSLRGTVNVSAKLQASDGSLPELDVTKNLTLRGPGDVIGLDAAQIIRREPTLGTMDAESTFMVHIEFDRPELPWLFSPYAPTGNSLKPWLALVVCDAENAVLMPGNPGLPQVLATVLGELPSLDDAAYWAHAQVVGAINEPGEASVADRLSDAHAPANLSRILCPRQLDGNRSYIACLVPAFDCGVQAGLGKSGGTLQRAWERKPDGSDAASQIVLPVYDSWTFRTGAAGDFKSLAEKLDGIAAPWQIGRRMIDCSNPGHGIAPLAAEDAGAVQVLSCALVSPQAIPENSPQENNGWNAAKRDELRLQVDAANAAGNEDLPRVGPRLYAKFQRGQSLIGEVFGNPAADTAKADGDWFSELNTSPIYRIVAGLGTRVVQKDQEQLMQGAWAQVGDIEKANNALKRHQFGRYVNDAIHRLHLAKLDTGTLTQIMRGVHGKIRTDSGALTVYGSVNESRTAPAAMTAAFRRVTRLRGPLARMNAGVTQKTLQGMIAENDAFKDFRRQYVNPDGVGGLSQTAINAIPSALLAKKLGITEALAAATLSAQLTANIKTTVADSMLTPIAAWRIPAGQIDLGAMLADTINAQVTALLPNDAVQQPAVSEPLSALLVGLANSGVASVTVKATQQVQNIDKKLVFSQGSSISLTPLQTAPHAVMNLSVTTPIAIKSVASRSIVTNTGLLKLNSGVSVAGRQVGTVLLDQTKVPIDVNQLPIQAPSALSRFETSVSRALVTNISKLRAVPYLDFAAALSEISIASGLSNLPATPDRTTLKLNQTLLLQAVEPGKTMSRYVKGRIAQYPGWLAADWFDDLRIDPIMAAPQFNRPMYEALDAYDRDWLVPGLSSIVETDFVTLLETNPAFTEAFLLGLSDEMGRELLWRGYPTDQRGTYFKRFWNHNADELTGNIHTFSPNPLPPLPLGMHVTEGNGDQGYMVFVVRGALVRRYPHAMVAAVLQEKKPDGTDDSDITGRPIFSVKNAEYLFPAVHLAPDYLLVGFKLTKVQMINEAWWFIIAEHPTAPRFGLKEASRDNAGIVASTLLRNPVRAAFKGSDLITSIQLPRGPNA